MEDILEDVEIRLGCAVCRAVDGENNVREYSPEFLLLEKQLPPDFGDRSCRVSKNRPNAKGIEADILMVPLCCNTEDRPHLVLHQLPLFIERIHSRFIYLGSPHGSHRDDGYSPHFTPTFVVFRAIPENNCDCKQVARKAKLSYDARTDPWRVHASFRGNRIMGDRTIVHPILRWVPKSVHKITSPRQTLLGSYQS